MSDRAVIVGVDLERATYADAITLGALLARLTDSRLTLVSAFKPHRTTHDAVKAEHERALRRAAERLAGKLEGLEVQRLVLAGASAGEVLHELAQRSATEAIVVASSRKASPGHAHLGRVTQHLLDGGTARVAVAPLGFAGHEDGLHEMGVAYAPGTTESDGALRYAALLAARAGAALRVLSAYDPSERLLVREHSHSEGELAAHARSVLAGMSGEPARQLLLTASLLEGDPVEALADASAALDLLVMGSRGREPLRVVLAGVTAGPLLHRAACALLVVPVAASPGEDG
jgi:nucleotide-binding universal stress UspA family protein